MNQQPAYIPAPSSKKGMSGGAIAAIIGGIVLVIVIVCGGLLTVIVPAVEKVQKMASDVALSHQNLLTISTALHSYAAENRGMMPEAGADLATRLAKYGVTQTTLTTPAPPPGGPRYFVVPIGSINAVKFPATTIHIYENPGIEAGIGYNIAMADGSVQMIPADQYRAMIDAIKLPDGTPYTPHK